MVVGVAQFELFMPANHSLKEKRQILSKLKDKVFSKFKINIAEVEHQDLWQRAKMGFSIVGNDSKKIESLIAKLINYIISMGLGEVVGESKEILYFDS